MYRLNKQGGVTRIDDGAFIPCDPRNADYQAYLSWLDVGNAPLDDTPPVDIMATMVAAAQERLDAFARTRNYDGILSACTYATSKIARFAAEGQRAVDLRDQTWAALYTILDQVQAGDRPMPTSFDDVAADLPPLTWS